MSGNDFACSKWLFPMARRLAAAMIVCALSVAAMRASGQTPEFLDRGLLANPGMHGQAVKSVYFFAGDWRKAPPNTWFSDFYGRKLGDNTPLYTIYPNDPRHLGWSENADNRAYAIDQMVAANVNTVTMSYWGLPTDDRWAFWAPMHTSPVANDQVFDAVGQKIVIIPAIESGACTKGSWQGWDSNPAHPKLPGAWEGQSVSFNFASEFPWFRGDPSRPFPENGHPAPRLVDQVEDLVRRYVVHPANPAWPSRWAQIYDRSGKPRYAIALLHVSSNQISANDHRTFVAGFNDVAAQVAQDLHVPVGFTLDIVPVPHAEDQNCHLLPSNPRNVWRDTFIATPEVTGPLLRDADAVLAIQAFIPEVWSGKQLDENQSRPWKQDFIRRWVAHGPPVFLDVDPGYRTHQDFDATKPLAGWGWNDQWFNFQSELKATGIRGITFNTWNGYTEGYAAVPLGSAPHIDTSAASWITHLFAVDPRVCDHWHFLNRTATFHVYGSICDKWRALGGSEGELGQPISSEHRIACSTTVRQTDFATGDVVFTAGGTFEVHGDIDKLWRKMGGACGTAGVPVGDEIGPANSRSSAFQKGSIHWTSGGAFWVPAPGGIHTL